MMKIAAVCLTMLMCLNAVASDFHCKQEYEKRIRAIEKRSELGHKVFATTSAGCFLLYPVSISAIGVCLGGSVALLGGVAVADLMFFNPGKDSFLDVYGALVEAQTSREEFLFMQAEAYEQFKQKRDMLSAIQVKPYREQKKVQRFGKYNEAKGKTFIDNLASDLNAHYEDVKQIIERHSADDTFCPDGKELKSSAFRNLLEKLLKAR